MKKRRHKYGVAPKAQRTYRDHVFASKKELLRYLDLAALEKAGEVRNLELQPKYPLVVGGVKVGTYIADFKYRTRAGKDVVEDVKGVVTAVYRIKRKLVRALYGVEILET